MKRTLFYSAAVLLATAVCVTGCKDDSEDDLNVGPSEVTGVFINEVCSSGTDWVELYNASDVEVSLAGFRLQDSKGTEEEYVFPSDAVIAAHSFLVLEKDADFEFGISGDGDEIKLFDASYKPVDNVVVPALEDGQTYARTQDGGAQWTTMAAGTKGKANTAEPDEQPEQPNPGESTVNLVINEVMSATLDGEYDFIEIYNPGTEEVDMGGFILQDEKGEADQYVIPANTKIAPKSVFLFMSADENPDGFGFGLGAGGDKVVFLDGSGNLIDEVELSAMEKGTSYARIPDGAPTWSVTAAPTKGVSNGVAEDEPLELYINEVFTNNQDERTAADWDDTRDFIELYNPTDKDIDLEGFSLNDEDKEEDKKYVFPAGTVILARSFFTVDAGVDDGSGASFGLGRKGDAVYLYDKDGNQIDAIEDTGEFGKDEVYSIGRKTDGASELVVFTEVSKNASNNGKAEK